MKPQPIKSQLCQVCHQRPATATRTIYRVQTRVCNVCLLANTGE